MNFVYLTKNLITNKMYIGSHCTENVNDGYIGSGHALLISIKKHGKENFHREILEYCDDIIDARKLEEFYINEYDTLSPNGYNISPTGGLGEWSGKHSKDSLNKMSISQKKRFENIKERMKISIRFKDKTYYEMYGIDKSNELKEKRKNAMIINNPIKPGKVHPNYGKILSDDIKKKISESNKNKPKSEKHKESLIKAWAKRKIERPTTDETKQKMKDSSKGKINIKIYKITDPSGNIYITDEGLTKFCEEHNLQRSLMCKVSKGSRKHHKGWKCEKC